MVCATIHADIEIQPCRRVSPLRRKLEGAAWATKCELEARGNVEPLLTAAARDAFGNLGVGTLRAMCESCLLDDGGEEFDLVYRLADHALGTDVMTSEEGLRILEKRKMPRTKDFDTDILTMPEVSDVLERREVEAVDACVASKEDAIFGARRIQEEVARTRRVHRDVALGEEGEEGAQGLPCHEVATGSA